MKIVKISLIILLVILWCRPRSGAGTWVGASCHPRANNYRAGIYRPCRHQRYLRAGSFRSIPSSSSSSSPTSLLFVFFLLLLSGDVELNPGPGNGSSSDLEAGPSRPRGEGQASPPNRVFSSSPRGNDQSAHVAREVLKDLMNDSASPIFGPGQRRHIRWDLELMAHPVTVEGFDLPEWRSLYILNRNGIHSLMEEEPTLNAENQGDTKAILDFLSRELKERVVDVPKNILDELNNMKDHRDYLWSLDHLVETISDIHLWGCTSASQIREALAEAWKRVRWDNTTIHAYNCKAMSEMTYI